MYYVQVLSTEEINKYFSSTNKLPHTCKDHLKVTTENEAICSFLLLK